MTHDPGPLDPSLRALLDAAEADAPSPPPEILESVLVRLQPPPPPPASPAAAHAVAPARISRVQLAGSIGLGVAVIAAVAVGVWRDRGASSATPMPSPPPLAAPLGEAGDANADAFAAETELIDRARGALARQRFHDTRMALDAHAQAFPGGLLEEEREALRVLLDLAAGEPDADARARRFIEQRPHSLFATTIERARRRE